ncbi:MAG: hypothetical protein IPF99_26070, partial [Deltaproteobacteria bacterium]|nr:hypothetical protein [Deltaproteobacteria bacterium]
MALRETDRPGDRPCVGQPAPGPGGRRPGPVHALHAAKRAPGPPRPAAGAGAGGSAHRVRSSGTDETRQATPGTSTSWSTCCSGTRHTDGPLWRHLAHFGATGYNATTGALITSYFEQGDASQVDRLLWLESERLAFGLDAITPANVALERDLVWSEHELRADRTEAAREGALLDAL